MIKPTVSFQYLRTPKHSYTLPAAPVHLQNTTSAFMSTPNHWAVHERNQPVRETRVVLDLERYSPSSIEFTLLSLSILTLLTLTIMAITGYALINVMGGFGSGPVSVPFSWMRHVPAFQSKEIRYNSISDKSSSFHTKRSRLAFSMSIITRSCGLSVGLDLSGDGDRLVLSGGLGEMAPHRKKHLLGVF
jgi:hypothetical protein